MEFLIVIGIIVLVVLFSVGKKGYIGSGKNRPHSKPLNMNQKQADVWSETERKETTRELTHSELDDLWEAPPSEAEKKEPSTSVDEIKQVDAPLPEVKPIPSFAELEQTRKERALRKAKQEPAKNRTFTREDMAEVEQLSRSELKDLFLLIFERQGYQVQLNPYRYRNSPDLLLEKGKQKYEAYVFTGRSISDRDWEATVDGCNQSGDVLNLFLTNAKLTSHQRRYVKRAKADYIEQKGLYSLMRELGLFASDVDHHL